MADSTRLLYSNVLVHVLPASGGLPLPAITPAVVREWHAKLKSQTGPTMRAHAYTAPGRKTMARVLYTAHAHVTGGREDGHGLSADGEPEVHLRVPKEMGGTGGGTNPEELFAVGYAACFESALGTVARRRHLDAGPTAIHSAVSLLPDGGGASAACLP